MKVRIEYTVEVTDEELRALSWFEGYRDGRKADRETVRNYFLNYGNGECGGRENLNGMVEAYYEGMAKEYAEKAKALKAREGEG